MKGYDATVRVWDLTSHQQIGEPLTGHIHWVNSVACGVLDRRPIAITGSNDRTVRLWSLGPPYPAAVRPAIVPFRRVNADR